MQTAGSNRIDFRTTKPQLFRDMGGEHVAVYRGRCRSCGRRTYGLEGKPGTGLAFFVEPDPRGVIGPRNAACLMEAEQHDATGPDALFCWDCVNEHGSAGYQACLRIARRMWLPIGAEVNS